MIEISAFNRRSILVKGVENPFLYVSRLQEELVDLADIIPAFQEILLVFKKEIDLTERKDEIRELLEIQVEKESNTRLRIPICFDAEFALDHERVEKFIGHKMDEIIKEMCDKIYEVAFLGFLPGYAYMKGLPDRFRVPRLESPRHLIEKGSFAIAENQVGIYPNASPGGWNILGNCPIEIFDVQSEEVSLFKPGDQVKFYSISKEEHQRLRASDFSRKAFLI